MTEPERVDGRIRDLAELCSRHGTPCADGLLAEIGRLRTDIERERTRALQQEQRAEMWKDEERITRASLSRELERTEGDLGVAIREAAAARAELAALGEQITEYGSPSMRFNGQETTNWGDRYWVGATLGRTVRRGPEWIVDHDVERAALDQRLTR